MTPLASTRPSAPTTSSASRSTPARRSTRLHPPPYGLFSEEQLNFLYDYFLEVTVPCLEANGVAVPALPSREDFLVPSTQLKQVWIPYYSLEMDGNVAFLMTDRCRYVPEGFPSF